MDRIYGIPGCLEDILSTSSKLVYPEDIAEKLDSARTYFNKMISLSDEAKGQARELARVAAEFAPSQHRKSMYRKKKGLLAELDVIEVIERPTFDEYYMFNNVELIKNRYVCQLDHVLIGPKGVFIIETKSWSEAYQQGDPSGVRREFKTYKQMKFQSDMLKRYLRHVRHPPIKRVLCDKEGTFFFPPRVIRRFHPIDKLESLLKRRKVVLDFHSAAAIGGVCARGTQVYHKV